MLGLLNVLSIGSDLSKGIIEHHLVNNIAFVEYTSLSMLQNMAFPISKVCIYMK